jgi:hypothetical protein
MYVSRYIQVKRLDFFGLILKERSLYGHHTENLAPVHIWI